MSMESLLNLDTLTEEERKIILSVLKKDDELRKTQDKKIGHLKLEIQAIRMKSVLRNGDDLAKICARCHAELGFLFNRGDLCPKCHFKVCRACQEQVLGGTWLCILCHKQRQLKFFMEEWNKGKPKKAGTELVKASMIKQRRPGRVNDDHSTLDKTRGVQNGNSVQNGSAIRNKKEAHHESERIEYPNDSDRRKLNQLFDTFKINKSSEKPDYIESKHQVSVKKLSTKRYEDSDEDSSSSDDDRNSREHLQNFSHRITDTQSEDNVSVLNDVQRGVLQRNYSDDSDQTAMSDETPFLKNTGSTETQIRVEIHSDSSGTSQKIKAPGNDQCSDKIKDRGRDKVARNESISSYRSTSPEVIDTPRQAYWQNRSPSPYSFDSIPSSHADSPLPKKRLSSELNRRDSDTDSRVSGYSGVSGTAEHSGTESAVKDSGEEYTLEEFSNVRFRRVSTKKQRSPVGSSETSPIDDAEAYQRGNSGKGRVHILDFPKEKASVQISEISLSDIEKDVDSEDNSYVNLEIVPTPTSKSCGKGLIGAGNRSNVSGNESLRSAKNDDVDSKSKRKGMVQKMDKELKSSERTLRNVQKLNSELKTQTEKEIKKETVTSASKTNKQAYPVVKSTSEKSKLTSTRKSDLMSTVKHQEVKSSQNSSFRSVDQSRGKSQMSDQIETPHDRQESKDVLKSKLKGQDHGQIKSQKGQMAVVQDNIKHKDLKSHQKMVRDESFEDIVSDVQSTSNTINNETKTKQGQKRNKATVSLGQSNHSKEQDCEFDEIFSIALADLSVEESTDMSDAGSISRAKGKRLKSLRKRKKSEKKGNQDVLENNEESKNSVGKKQMDEMKSKSTEHREELGSTPIAREGDKHAKGREVTLAVKEKEVNQDVKEREVTHAVKEREVTRAPVIEEVINPVCVLKEDVALIPATKMERMAVSSTTFNSDKSKLVKKDQVDYNKATKKQQSSPNVQLDGKSEECLSKGESTQSSAKNIDGGDVKMASHKEIDIEQLSLSEIMELMRSNVLPMDEELFSLLEEQFAQNRDFVLPSLLATAASDSDELSIINEESEPSESDISLENNQNKLEQGESKVTHIIPEVKVEDYEEIMALQTKLSAGSNMHQIESLQNVSTEKRDENTNFDEVDSSEMQMHDAVNSVPGNSEIKRVSSVELENEDKYNNSKTEHVHKAQSSTKELAQFYQEVKQKVALECYMEAHQSKRDSTKCATDDNNDDVFDENVFTKQANKNEFSDVTCIKQAQYNNYLSNVQDPRYKEDSDVKITSVDSLQKKDMEILQNIELYHETIADDDISDELAKVHASVESSTVSNQSQVDPRPVVVSQYTRSSSVTLEVDDSDTESYIAVTANETGSPIKIVSELKIDIPPSPIDEKMTVHVVDTKNRSSMMQTPEKSICYQKFGTPYPEGHTPSRADVSADITLTPTERSIDSEGTFCALLEDNVSDKEVKEIIGLKLKKYEESDLVGHSLSREVLVKQWLTSKSEIRDDNSSPQSDFSETASEKMASINPALQSETPACGLTSQEMPKLNMQDWKESEPDSITKLSPRASSEGSASFEDSGHVSGASTQENTPEHRRTDSLQSQTSMGSSRLSTVTDKESEEDPDIDEIVKSHRSLHSSAGGSRGNLLSAESKESIMSFYSNAGDIDYGKIPVTGDIQFGLDYNYRTGTLEIHICQCKGLAPADTRRNRSDPYVKTYLLPDKTRSGKRKTKIKKHTLNPVFDEKLRYLISKSELENRTVWVTVWHNDRFGRNDFLGEVTINFDYYRFGDTAPKWYKLQERIPAGKFEQPTSLLTYKGDIILCLKYVPPEKVNRDVPTPSPTRKKVKKPKIPGDKGQLHVLIKEARNLTAVRSNGFSDPFCKGQLQPDKEKQKTSVIKKECNPAWNCTMVFDDVTVENLKEKSLELTIWDHDKLSSNDFLGGVRLNLGTGRSCGKIVDWMDARGEEISLWQAMIDRPNFWIDGALVLRSTMSKRK